MSGYVELQCTTHFSFLRGASSCDELFERAKELGITALGIADRNSLAGIVRARIAAKATGVRLIVGCRLDLIEGMTLLVYPMHLDGYKRLCRLLTIGKRRAGKGECHLNWADVEQHSEGLLAILIPEEADDTTAIQLRKVKAVFGNAAYMSLTLRRRPNDQLRLHKLSNMATQASVQSVVTNDVLFHEPEREIMQDVVTCIRHNCTVDELGKYREPFADRYLKPPAEMYRLFPRNEQAVARSQSIAARCQFSLDELTYKYPAEKTMPGLTAQRALEHLTWEGAATRYPDGLPDDVAATLRHELNLISKLEYAPYFLTVNTIVRYARSQNILCQGRGSAANSAVCFVLGITSIDPNLNDLLFERFVSEERREPPDIDVDFESDEQRENVIQWVFSHYGRDHAALCSTVQRYRSKGAWHDVAKAMGLPQDLISTLSSQLTHWTQNGIESQHLEGLNINLNDRRLRLAITLSQQLLGTPRHLSQHPGGFVLTDDRLDELVPIEPATMVDRQVIEWDKDDIDEMKFMKMDCLGLGMLKCMRIAFELMEKHKGIKVDLATIPPEDPATFAMIRKADTLGTFQIESRAQMNSLPRTKPRTFYDLVIQVAIVRPGPIQGDMVHPYLRRRDGMEKVTFPKPELERVLGKTLGVPLFQEQAMRIAIECAGFTPSEADQLRRSMATFKFTGGVSKYKEKLISGMTANGYDEDFAEKVFSQIEGFGSYGFPESHAASFALIAYASCWLKCHHPEVFCTALLNAQPMGFYAEAQIVTDTRRHGVTVLPVCVNASRWENALEPIGDTGRFAVRLGFRMIKGMKDKDAAKIVTMRADHPYSSVDEFWHRSGVGNATLVKLADADAFQSSLKLPRREALWAIKALRDEPLPLFAAAARQENSYIREVVEPPVSLKAMTAGNEVVHDYHHVGLTLRAHPMSFLRNDLAKADILTCAQASNTPDEKYIRVAGMVLIRQMPGSAKGVMFITIEDETGHTNVVVWPKKYDAFRRVIHSASMMMISGQIQREGDVVHLIARSIVDFSEQLANVGDREEAFPLPHGRGDEFHHGSRPDPRDGIKVKTRDFR